MLTSNKLPGPYYILTTTFIHTPRSLFEPSFKACILVKLSEFSKNLFDGSSPRKTTLRRQKGEMLSFSGLSLSGYIKDKAKSRLYNMRLVGVKWQ